MTPGELLFLFAFTAILALIEAVILLGYKILNYLYCYQGLSWTLGVLNMAGVFLLLLGVTACVVDGRLSEL